MNKLLLLYYIYTWITDKCNREKYLAGSSYKFTLETKVETGLYIL